MGSRLDRRRRTGRGRGWSGAGVLGVVLGCGAAAESRAGAATITWTGAAGGPNWAAPMNWDLNHPPFNGDDVFFGPSPQTATVDNITFRTLASITFDPAVA